MEYIKPTKAPGPAFITSYDNRYKDKTSFANDSGRVKEPLNVNKVKQEFLKSAEKAEFLQELKETSIKFLHPEMGSNKSYYVKGQFVDYVDHTSGMKVR